MKDPYKTLGIEKNADEQTIKKAYKKLAMKYHPDRVQDEKEKQEYTNKFKDIGEAYDVLGDPEKKKIYDTYGEEGLNGGGGGGGGNFNGGSYRSSNIDPEEIFKNFFGGGFPKGKFGGGNGFSNFEFGGKGFGGNFGNFGGNFGSSEEDSTDEYFSKNPKKKKYQKQELKKAEPLLHTVNCTLEDLYHQKTKKIKINRKIQNDEKNTTEEKILSFDLRPGCREGTKIRFEREGDQLFGYENSDVIFTLSFKKHKNFEFEKSNLIYRKEIPLLDALKSNITFNINTLDDRTLNVNVKEIITPTYEKIIKGEGLPKQNGEKGDLIIRFDIKFPNKLSDDQKIQLQKIF
jgi:DnaJ homolog subfamily B member 4